MLGDRIRLSVLDDKSKSDSIYVRIATRSSSGSIPSIVRSLHTICLQMISILFSLRQLELDNQRCAAQPLQTGLLWWKGQQEEMVSKPKSRIVGTRRFDCGKQVE